MLFHSHIIKQSGAQPDEGLHCVTHLTGIFNLETS